MDFQQVQSAVLRECSVNLVRVKEAIASNVAGTLDVGALDSWPGLIAGIKAGLMMLGKTRAVEIVDGIATNLKDLLQPGGTAVPPNYLDRLADAVVSLEYYMETLQAGRTDPWYMLDNAQTCLHGADADAEARGADRAAAGPGGLCRHRAAGRCRRHGARPCAAGRRRAARPSRARRRCTIPAQPPIGAKPINIDPELLALYIEEAREEVARIGKLFPAWEQNPLETEALSGVRRAFHTLKGSGRMVGATDISEFAWAIENLLNRIIENTLQRSPAHPRHGARCGGRGRRAGECARGRQARAGAHPGHHRSRARAGCQQGIRWRRRATMESLERTLDTSRVDMVEATGRVPTLQAAPESPRASPPLSQSAPEAANRMAARRAENRRRVKKSCCRRPKKKPVATCSCAKSTVARPRSTSRQCCASSRQRAAQEAPHVVSEEAYRACHTLAGSSRMAEARHGIRLTAPLEHWVRKSFDSGVGLDGADLELLTDCMNAMQSVAPNLDESTGFFQSHGALLARIEQATEELDSRIIAAAGPRSWLRTPLQRRWSLRPSRFLLRRRSRHLPLPFRPRVPPKIRQ